MPAHGYEFVWDNDGPFQHTGGWKGSYDEYSQIIAATLTKPKYILLQIRSALRATIIQLQLFKAGDGNTPFSTQSPLYKEVADYLPGEAQAFSHSLQNTGRLLPITVWQGVMNAAIVLSILMLPLLVLPGIRRNPQARTIIFILLAGILVNAWDCATFANAIDRLGARMAWLAPLAAIVLVAACMRKPAVTG